MTERSFDIPQKYEFTVTKPEQTALDLLAEATGLSKQRIKDAMNKGAVWWTLKGKTLRLRRATKMLHKGSIIQFFYDEQVLSRKPESATLIYDAEDYSIWYKPAGMLAQGSQWGDHCSILRWVEVNGDYPIGKSQRDCFLVHRLDADASGLMIIAHDSKSAAKLSVLFQGRDIKKYYQAWVVDDCELPAEGMTLSYELDGKSAITHIKKIGASDEIGAGNKGTLLDVHIETGRKHQIRRHLANIGHPIVGDKIYGTKAKCGLQLLAYRLEFVCPVSQKNLVVELPKEQQFSTQI